MRIVSMMIMKSLLVILDLSPSTPLLTMLFATLQSWRAFIFNKMVVLAFVSNYTSLCRAFCVLCLPSVVLWQKCPADRLWLLKCWIDWTMPVPWQGLFLKHKMGLCCPQKHWATYDELCSTLHILNRDFDSLTDSSPIRGRVWYLSVFEPLILWVEE